jgi:2-oxoglutarate ferredoxin oxidoreductase subunit gamma
MEHSIVLAGFGGQGLLFAGEALAQAALIEGREVSWMPSYGPEMRGGTASCTVIIADRPIGSPLADPAEVVLAMNPPSLAKFEPLVEPGGLLIVNESLVEAQPVRKDIEIAYVRCTELATAAGDGRLTTVVALGVLFARRPWVSTDSLRDSLRHMLSGRGETILAADLAAFAAGLESAPKAGPILVG